MTSNDHDDEGCGDNEDLQRPNDGEEHKSAAAADDDDDEGGKDEKYKDDIDKL